jgi:hypothetical protein
MAHVPAKDPIQGLPENARRPLAQGESYVPLVPEETSVPEVTSRPAPWPRGSPSRPSVSARP